MTSTLYDKVFDLHVVRELGEDQYQLFIGLHLIHEATSPQAFSMLAERGMKVAYPERNVATVDHVIPTDDVARPFADPLSEAMISALEANTSSAGLRFLSPERRENGIVHVVGPERGLTQPGLTIVCGDSHTATHGAFGALAFGIGTSQVRDVLGTQTVVTKRLKVRRIEITGALAPGITAKDVILHVIHHLGSKAGVGYAYEFGGPVVDAMSMDERMTVCNMVVEGGALVGYCNPDETTFAYLDGRPSAPQGEDWDRAVAWWRSLRSDDDAVYDDKVVFDGAAIGHMITWGVNLAQSVPVDGLVPERPPATRRRPWRTPARSWGSSRVNRSPASVSTWPSSAPARTGGSRTSRRWPRSWCAPAPRWPRGYGPSPSPAPTRCGPRWWSEGWTWCSNGPASSSGSRAAPCASR